MTSSLRTCIMDVITKQDIRSVEHGICPIAEFTSPWLNCAAILAIRPIIWAKLHIIFMAHARNGHISKSCQKSDVTIVFPDPEFL